MTYEILKANAVQRRNFRRAGYVRIELLCEHISCTAGLVYRFSDLKEFLEQNGSLPEAVEHMAMTSLADAVNELYSGNLYCLAIVEAQFPRRTPEPIKQNYLLYGLWTQQEFAEDIAKELKRLEHSVDN